MYSDERVIHHENNGQDLNGKYIFYWMQSAQRTIDNHALEFAIRYANQYKCPLHVGFVLMPEFPNANKRHFTFMLEGLCEVATALHEIGAKFELVVGKPEEVLLKWTADARSVVFDAGYGTFEKSIRDALIHKIDKEVFVVDTNLVVPAHIAYPKEAYAAYAIRSSIMRKLDNFLYGTEVTELHVRYEGSAFEIDVAELMSSALSSLQDVPASPLFRGGQSIALQTLDLFLEEKLQNYDRDSSNPGKNACSFLSPYLHFGQISPVTIARRARATGLSCDSFIEQLIVRRELAYNYIHYAGNAFMDLKLTLPSWAYETLQEHRDDIRAYIYDLETMERGETHDPYWNAAQKEMVITGYMHGTMRMYWGKKVIEWSDSPELALKILLYLNDKYELDGRDPNGYAGILWCFGKHDRPWRERPVFGKIRYMNAAGLTRKYDMNDYLARIKALEGDKFEG